MKSMKYMVLKLEDLLCITGSVPSYETKMNNNKSSNLFSLYCGK